MNEIIDRAVVAMTRYVEGSRSDSNGTLWFIYDSTDGHCAFSCPNRAHRDEHLRRLNAMAVIKSLRDPTTDQIVDGFEAMNGDWKMCRDAADDARRCWHAMIDAALK